MLARIFGKPKAPEPPKQVSVIPQASSPTDTLSLLRKQEATLEKRMEHLENQMKTLKERAGQYVQAGDKPKALALLKQKAILEDQFRSTSGMLEKIIQQRLTLEMGQIQVQTIRAMEVTNTYMKTTAIDVDKVSDIIDDTAEQMEASKEITRLVCEPLPGQSEMNETAEAELASMMDVQQAPVQVQPNPFAMPNPPSTVPQTMEEELKALELAETPLRVAVPS